LPGALANRYSRPAVGQAPPDWGNSMEYSREFSAAGDASHSRPLCLTSEPFRDALGLLHLFGEVEGMLAFGENPLSSQRPTRDLYRLFSAADRELAADLAGVLGAANAGSDGAGLAILARAAVGHHIERIRRLLDWYKALGLPVYREYPAFVGAVALAICTHANRQPTSTVRSPSFAALTDAFWHFFHDWNARGLFPTPGRTCWGLQPVRSVSPAVPCEPRGAVRSAGDVRRNLRRVFDWCNRLGAREAIRFDGVAPLTHYLSAADVNRIIHRLDVADGSAVSLPDTVVFISEGTGRALGGPRTHERATLAVGHESPARRAGTVPRPTGQPPDLPDRGDHAAIICPPAAPSRGGDAQASAPPPDVTADELGRAGQSAGSPATDLPPPGLPTDRPFSSGASNGAPCETIQDDQERPPQSGQLGPYLKGPEARKQKAAARNKLIEQLMDSGMQDLQAIFAAVRNEDASLLFANKTGDKLISPEWMMRHFHSRKK
jgi:hypothetical protein